MFDGLTHIHSLHQEFIRGIVNIWSMPATVHVSKLCSFGKQHRTWYSAWTTLAFQTRCHHQHSANPVFFIVVEVPEWWMYQRDKELVLETWSSGGYPVTQMETNTLNILNGGPSRTPAQARDIEHSGKTYLLAYLRLNKMSIRTWGIFVFQISLRLIETLCLMSWNVSPGGWSGFLG